MALSQSKQKYIDYIVSELEKGQVSFERVFELFLTKFNCSRPTFATYWKIANESYTSTQNSIKATKEVQTITNELDKLKKANLTKIDRLLIAESIALNEDGTANNSDKLKALDYLSKIEGDYAPTKTANTNSQGEDVATTPPNINVYNVPVPLATNELDVDV